MSDVSIFLFILLNKQIIWKIKEKLNTETIEKLRTYIDSEKIKIKYVDNNRMVKMNIYVYLDE